MILEYKGYKGMYEISPQMIRGRLLLDKDLVTFETTDLLAVRKEFEAAVDDYIETCAELGWEPKKPRQESV